jgi:hypothetical protein
VVLMPFAYKAKLKIHTRMVDIKLDYDPIEAARGGATLVPVESRDS